MRGRQRGTLTPNFGVPSAFPEHQLAYVRFRHHIMSAVESGHCRLSGQLRTASVVAQFSMFGRGAFLGIYSIMRLMGIDLLR